VVCKGVDCILCRETGHPAWNVGQCQVRKKESDILKLMTINNIIARNSKNIL